MTRRWVVEVPRRAGLIAIAIVWLAALVHADGGVEEGAPIVAIQLDCTAPIDQEGLLRLLPMQVGDPFRAADLVEAERRVKLTERFTEVTLEAQHAADGVMVHIYLVRQIMLNAIRFRGYQTPGDAELRRAVRLQEGGIFNDDLRDYAIGRLREHYVELGFPKAEVRADVESLAPGEVDVTFVIDEGPPLRITSLELSGDVPVARADLLVGLPLQEGGRYSKSAAKAAEKSVLRLLRLHDYYEAEVESSWTETAPNAGTLRFTIQPGPLFEITFHGNHYFGAVAILELMELADRPIITDGTWRELARRARRAYQGEGFHAVSIRPRIEHGNPRRVSFDIEEGPRRWIRKVSFEGNAGLGDTQLRSAMATQPPSWLPWNPGVLVDDTLDDDLRRLWFLYRRYGYLDAQILDARREIDAAANAIDLVVVIGEGRQTLVDSVEHEGFAVLGEMPPLRVHAGEPFDADAVEDDRRTLATALFKAGYATGSVDAGVSKALPGDTAAGMKVRFDATPGERHRIGLVVVQNNIDTRARVIYREVEFRRGDPFDPDALLAAQSRIYKLGLFRSVTVRPLGDGHDSPERDIVINVAERFPGTLQWGAGYNTRDGIRGFAEVGYSNLGGMARRVSLRGDFNFDPSEARPNDYIGNLGYLDRRLFNTLWTLRANLIAQRGTRAVDQFSIERLAFVPAIERPLFPGFTVGLDAQAETARIFDVARDVLTFNPRDEGNLDTVSFGPFLVFDGRDDPFQPTRGVFDSLRVRVAPAQLGSQIPFFKVVAQHNHYWPLSEQLTFVYALRVGWARTFDDSDVLPIRERFFLGGRTTVRGFAENAIGPKGAPTYDGDRNVVDRGGSPLGGDLVASLNTELRFPIAFGLGGALFFDGGAVYLQERPILWEDFRKTAGLGLRYATPVGPISLDYGIKLDRREGESIGQFHFSIGTIF